MPTICNRWPGASLPGSGYELPRRLLESGVRIMDPNTCYAGPRVTVGAGTVILPGTILRDMRVELPYPRDRWSAAFGMLFRQVMADMGTGIDNTPAPSGGDDEPRAPGRYSQASCC